MGYYRHLSDHYIQPMKAYVDGVHSLLTMYDDYLSVIDLYQQSFIGGSQRCKSRRELGKWLAESAVKMMTAVGVLKLPETVGSMAKYTLVAEVKDSAEQQE